MDERVAKFIRDERKRRLMSLRRLARFSRLSPAYLSQIENGKRPLTPKAAGQIADGLGMHPYELLGLAGFISPEHIKQAEEMADRALVEAPQLKPKSTNPDEDERTWLVIDYLYLLGDDPYGTGWDGGPGGHHADWRVLDPSAPPPLLERLKPEIDSWKAEMEERAKTLDGWDQLTLGEKELVQNLVDRFIRQRTPEE